MPTLVVLTLQTARNNGIGKSDHQNIRDSRLEVFGDLDIGQTVQVVYTARASLGGSYQLPPVSRVDVDSAFGPVQKGAAFR